MEVEIRKRLKKTVNILKHWLRLRMWTSGGAILRDLSRAQGAAGGRMAHGELRALRPWDRPAPRAPPPRCLSDEMEEYVRGLAPGDAACEGAPDLRHIQAMLDMIRTLNVAEEEIANDEALIELGSYTIECSSSTNLCRAELAKPAHTPSATALGEPYAALEPVPDLPDLIKHKKRRRNIALESILESLESNDIKDASNCTSEECTLLKPEDLLGDSDHKKIEGTSYNKIDSNDKVNHWINQRMSPILRKSQSKHLLREAIRLDPISMFKRKVKVEVAKPCTETKGEAALRNVKSPGNGSVSYVPSADALLSYQRYLENNKQMQIRLEEREEASQLSVLITEALERAGRAEACGLSRSVRAAPASVRAAPAGVRLAAPRACLPQAPCLVCLRLTRRAAAPAPETWRRTVRSPAHSDTDSNTFA